MNQTSEIYIAESDFRKRYQYDDNDLIGEGGFAQVYKAYDKQFQEFVALKFYSKGDQGKYDVLHEMKDTRKFSHPNIIRIHDAFVVRFDHTGGHSFVQVGILEFANGGNLRDFIRIEPSEDKFKEVLTGILRGLDYIHNEKKMIHRDLSPENILMYNEGDSWIPKIADFGISKRIDYVSEAQDRTKSTQLLGKIDYMAPEQFYPEKFGINGRINTNVDLWAFGVILFELFMGRKPFGNDVQENPLEVIRSITSDSLSNLDQIPEPYRLIIKRCLEKRASNRIMNSGELIAMLLKPQVNKHHQLARTIQIKNITLKGKKPVYYYVGVLFAVSLLAAAYFIFRSPEHSVGDKPAIITPVIKISEIKVLIAQKKYKSAVDEISKLPEDLRKQKEFSDLYTLGIRSIQLDSLLYEADQRLKKGDYRTSQAYYRRILSEYDASNSTARRRNDSLNVILNQANPVVKSNFGIYNKGMFKVTINPKSNAIELESIEISKTATIISLKLRAGESRYFSSPGKNGAYFIEFNNRKGRLDLKDITGIKTGTFEIVEKDRIFQLYFNNLPEKVREFNLINGDEKFHSDYEYADFIGISI